MSKWLTAAAAVALLALPMLPARAAQQYDGRWVIDFPPAAANPSVNAGPGCPAMRIVVDIKDSQLSGNLGRELNSPMEVKNSAGPGAEPLKGSVTPDGSVAATWQNYAVTGKLAGDAGQVNVTGECGPRTGNAVRVGEQKEQQ